MHYIIGAQISVPDYTRAAVHSGVTQTSPQRTPGAAIKKFKPQSLYTLYNIQQTEDSKFKYTFTGSSGDVVKLIFESPSQGDDFIASARGEELPDYNKFYRGRN